eukprot:CAMPEP_0202944806 /NCGR_PEP_ID=MMETSP1395-20130829/5693_1 /ASSEMBLY_ACC=CAM_ASM_000871 /TAXON_ID=5961 /ORGANISM="Blepharisma japonicum, Strain Stock R1072" /LENGTH=314 /DNA_ID=CAMNT_0049644055 /DNA_START=34 /DNA_END=978 /DNA_ORIENTATION=+
MGCPARKFSLTETKYDQSKFYGRLKFFLSLVNPMGLLYTQAQADEAKQILEDYKNGTLKRQYTDEELWHARWLKEAVFHPDTNEPILKIFRLSAFGGVNIPIGIGMLLSPKTPFNIAFWQAVNQTNNVGFNYCNRSINNPFTNTQLICSYLLATGSSVLIGLKFDKFITRHSGNSVLLRTLGPATAVAVAGCFNLLVIRYRELYEGISVYDENGKDLGKSKIAAKDGLSKTLAIRFGFQYPVCFVPVITALGMRKMGIYPTAGIGKVLAEVFVISLSVFGVLPCCFAAYPQMLHADKLEPEFKSSTGFWYNRGL